MLSEGAAISEDEEGMQQDISEDHNSTDGDWESNSQVVGRDERKWIAVPFGKYIPLWKEKDFVTSLTAEEGWVWGHQWLWEILPPNTNWIETLDRPANSSWSC
jgi:hypothetical protein